ncbi:MAG: uncharacterized protein KVP18_000596 [Porospora cf. gigantea A]|nr:MAG: hypothetical protein KVP18_000596 [Porospora cf. gigantea A]
MVIELDPDTVDALEGVFVLYSMEHSFDEHTSEEVLSLDGFTSLISKVGLLQPDCLRYSDVEELFEEHATNGFLVFDAFPQCLVTAAQKCRFEFSDVMESILTVLTELGAYEPHIYATDYSHPADKSELITNELVPLRERSASSSFQEILKPSVAKRGVSPASTEAHREHHKLSRDFLRSQDQSSPTSKNRCTPRASTPRASTAFSSSDLSQLPARASPAPDFSFPPSSVFETPSKPSALPPLQASRTFSSSEPPLVKANLVQKKNRVVCEPEFEQQAEKTRTLSYLEPAESTKQTSQHALPSHTESSEPPRMTSDVDEGQSVKVNSAVAPASVTTEASPARSREELKAEKAARKAERNRKRAAKAARAADRDRRRAEKQLLAAA